MTEKLERGRQLLWLTRVAYGKPRRRRGPRKTRTNQNALPAPSLSSWRSLGRHSRKKIHTCHLSLQLGKLEEQSGNQ
uniref:DNA-binding protein MNB1B n=1 Tax=Rhizophora mucronata TaxID=61149 RepID=A0A2P2MCD1_RHIMU